MPGMTYAPHSHQGGALLWPGLGAWASTTLLSATFVFALTPSVDQ